MGSKKSLTMQADLKKIIRKLLNTFPFLGWLRLAYQPRKLIRTISYHARIYQALGRSFKGLHLGGGGIIIETFLNIDGNPAAPSDVVGGVERIHLRDRSVECIYSSHVFEHIPRSRITAVLGEWWRVLKPGGKLYICVPDLEVLSRIYIDGLSDYCADPEVRARVDLACGVIFGGQVNRFDYHFHGYSFQTLAFLLKGVGFASVDRFDRESLKEDFPFVDASFAHVDGVPISLNLIAVK